MSTPLSGAGYPHQGGLVQTQNGDWYYASFLDAYPGGRIPSLAPVTWKDGWPSLTLSNGGWGATYPFPNLPCGAGRVKPLTGVDTFATAALGPEWEWNHNPDDTKWSSGMGLTLQTGTVTDALYAAQNTLTHRILGPSSTATIELDPSAMKDGDMAGLALFRADGKSFQELGSGFTMKNAWEFFMGYRFGLFNYATQALGGSVKIAAFELAASP